MDKNLRREELYSLLGDLPERNRPIKAWKVTEQERESYVLETLMLDLNGFEPVPAYFAKPKNATGRLPTIIYNHAHGGAYDIGKEEMIKARAAIQSPPYAEQAARLGFNAICIDTWNFGERRGRKELDLYKEMIWKGQVLWGMMVYDSLRTVDYLLTRADVDAGRLATMGLSMGSTMAWWMAALDERIKVCVDICCLTDYQALIEINGLDEHGMYYYVPSLLKHFTTAQINSLIAPRPHLSLAGNHDRLTPPAGLDRIDVELKKVYAAEGAAEAWKLLRYNIGHFETAAMRAEVVAFLKKWL